MTFAPKNTSESGLLSRPMLGRFIAFGFVFLAGLWIGIHQLQTQAQTTSLTIGAATTSTTLTVTPLNSNGEPNVNLSALWQTWDLLNQNFVNAHGSTTPSDQNKVYGMIEGLVNSYGDPYTTFFPPSDATIFNQDVGGSFSGVGMEVGADSNGNLTVIAPLKGSPAEAAGLRAGDIILAIDASSTQGMSVDDAVKFIRGPEGSTVKITIAHAGNPQPVVIPIVRQNIQIPDINYQSDPNGIYEIDLYNFSASSDGDFRNALRAFFESGNTKLLLDLRGNPGGYLNAAVDMASYFLPAGDVVVTEDYKGKQDNVVHRSYGYNVFANKALRMAILVDQGTASAAEILSGALQQHGVAKLVGTRTFGKGSVQEVFPLPNNAEVKITVARWLTPNGTSISNGGLTPDINATTTQADSSAGKDPQKDAAVLYLAAEN